MQARYFVIESFDGPKADGRYTTIAKDILKLADGDRSQAPPLSNGFLSADLTISATTATLLPLGIGNAEYATSGHVCIGGNEIVAFSRVGDVLTIARGQLGSTASTHKAQDRVQIVFQFVAADPADVIYSLLGGYAGISTRYMDLATWRAETAAFLGTVYSAIIAEPTSVATLVSELVQQAAMLIWWDESARQIRLKVLRGILTDADTFTPENTLLGSLTIKEQPDKRISRVQVYFGQKDPTKPLSNLDNFRSSSLTIDEDAEEDYGSSSIKTIMARWIPAAGRSIADRLGTVQLARYRDPPRRLTFATSRYADADVELGGGYRVESFGVQDGRGAQASIPIQVTRLNPGPERFTVEAEEMLYTAPDLDLTNRQVIFDTNNLNVNLRASHDSIYPPPVSGDIVTCTIRSGVVIGSTSTSLPSVDVGSWPAGVTVNLIIKGRVQGKGADGGTGGNSGNTTVLPGLPGAAGGAGGPAIYTRRAINLEFPSGGEIWGGGGGGATYAGGGGGGGGGGAGTNPSNYSSGGFGYDGGAGAGAAGTVTGGALGGAGGNGSGASHGGNAGNGGGPGLAGSAGIVGSSYFGNPGGAGGAGGAAGAAIDGSSYVTTTVSGGDRRGGLIN